MSARSVRLDGAAITSEQLAGGPAPGIGTLRALFGDDEAARSELGLPCRSGDADLWFAEAPAELERAKALCGACPIRTGCLAGALRREEPWGVWGGEIFERGIVIPHKRPRGHPRKADLARDDRACAAASA